ncbi:matrixin family metalloprotease [Hamadaea sp. NPDC051192]|uniref:matrixin family metalloprotease n=1 Tax=Hamadaea sp. NPDC051192 TaxID=3154940 RepID=UPI0034238E63
MAVAVGSLGPVSPAAANFSGATGATGCNDLNKADNATHSFHNVDLSTAMVNATSWARTNNVDPTDINTTTDPSLDGLTDVVVRDRYYVDFCGHDWYRSSTNGGVVGLATCDDTNSADECEQHTVRYNNYFVDNTSLTNERGLACHEIGHTLGLAHRTSKSCMQQGYPKPLNNYSAHDAEHINNNY